MDIKQNIDKSSFKQVGQELLHKVHEAERMDRQDILSSWQEIESQIGQPRSIFRLRMRYVASIAALVAILFSIGFYLWSDKAIDTSMSLTLLESDVPALSNDEIILIAKNDKMQLKDESSIKYESDGKSNVDKHIVKKQEATEETGKKEEINQIIVPKGRKANITFSDGTKMFVNAGTRVIYPAVFKKDKREILVEGEVYLEVSKDASRPFIVKTNGFDVKVLGTEFNICAYKNDPEASVVLVNGSVEVKTAKNEKSQLTPNQLIEINDKGTSIKEVDVFEYICWKDKMMFLDGKKLGEVLDRLSVYYGRTILFNDNVRDIPVSGKLDLREEMIDVVNILCESLFLKYSIDKDNNIEILK